MFARWFALIASLLLLVLMAAGDAAAEVPASEGDDLLREFFQFEGVPDDIEEPWREFVDGWEAFGSWHFMLQEFVSLLMAAGLASLIAFHPRSRPPIGDAESLERPKAIVLYGVICAAIAEIVLFNPPMAFVVFGIGGLLRFRSLIGSAKDTGRMILAAVMGLACGLKLFPLAVLGTGFGWILIFALESRVILSVEIRKLDSERISEAAEVWRAALEQRGCRIESLQALPDKKRLVLLVLVPRTENVEELQRSLAIPPELGEKAVWEWQT